MRLDVIDFIDFLERVCSKQPWFSIGRTHIDQGFIALRKGITDAYRDFEASKEIKMTTKHYMIYVNEPKYISPRWEHYKKGQYLIVDSLLDALEKVKEELELIKGMSPFELDCLKQSGFQPILQSIYDIVYPLNLPHSNETS